MFLWFGFRPALVVSTPSAIEECFTKNDILFANRPRFGSIRDFTSIGTAPYGNHWRNLRKFTSLHIFSSTQIQMSSGIRTEEILCLTKHLFFRGDQTVDVKSLMYMLSFNIMMKMVSGRRYFEGDEFDLDKKENKNKLDDIKQTFSPLMTVALGDFFPFLSWLSYPGVSRKHKRVHQKRDVFLQDLIDVHQNDKFASTSVSKRGKTRPIVDVMLSLQESEPEVYTNYIIKGIVQAMLIASTETFAITMEAAVSFLVSHPKILNKARNEIDANIEQSRLLEDGDLTKIAYLRWIISETLRLGPTVPMIPARESSGECTVGGFNIPCGTMLLVNTWALHMDTTLWHEPNEFKPERFEGTERKKEFNFIPFGSGRRQCPGASLAMRLMTLTLGILIQCFDWEKAKGDAKKITFRPRKTFITAFYDM